MPNQNGRNVTGARSRTDEEDRTERYGGGQSGYGAGRFSDDRSMGSGYRNQQGDRGYADREGVHTDERWTGRGGESQRGESGGGPYNGRGFEDRDESTGYNSGYNQGQGYGNYGPHPPQYGSQQGFRGGSGGSQQIASDGPGMRGGYGGSGTQGAGHRGKGPVGYTRSDDRIKEVVCEVLSDDDHIDASHIEVVVKNGDVMLTGTVEDRRTKRLAEDVIERLPGVKDVQNHLRVASDVRGMSGRGSTIEPPTDKKHRA